MYFCKPFIAKVIVLHRIFAPPSRLVLSTLNCHLLVQLRLSRWMSINKCTVNHLPDQRANQQGNHPANLQVDRLADPPANHQDNHQAGAPAIITLARGSPRQHLRAIFEFVNRLVLHSYHSTIVYGQVSLMDYQLIVPVLSSRIVA